MTQRRPKSSAEQQAFEQECRALGETCAAAKLRLDKRGPDVYRNAFASYRGPKRFPPYFERKWLSLRLSAVKRGMVVDASVTPAFLARITDGRCPVTLEPLDTQGKSTENPSVDRLVNEVTYLAGNVCVLSLRANRAKGELSFEQVARLAQAGESNAGLAPIEWMRMASLMYGAWSRAYKQSDPYLLPLAAIPGPGMFMSTSQVVQLLLTRHFSTGSDHVVAADRWLEMTRSSGCRDEVFISLKDLLASALAEEDHAGDAWLHGDVFEAFVRWYRACQDAVIVEVETLLLQHQERQGSPVTSRNWPTSKRYQH